MLCGLPSSVSGRPAGSATITNLPTADGTAFQVNSLNAAGQLTGYFVPPGGSARAFIYSTNGLTDLGTLGGPAGEGLAINSYGVVAGDSYRSDFEFHAFLSSSNGLVDLGTLGNMFSTPTALNDSNQVAGVSFLPDFSLQGFFYSDGVMTNVGTLGGNYSYAFSLNGFGAVVGESALSNGDIHAFLFVNNSISDLGTLPGGNYSSAASINDAGVIVGQANLATGETNAFLYSSNVVTSLGTLGGTFSTAFFVNQQGQVIGNSTTTNNEFHGFLYSNGTMTDLGTLGGNSSGVSGLNNFGQVVGNSSMSNGSQHPFLWQNGLMVDLNSLLPADSGWELISAERINDAGRIVGSGNYQLITQPYILDLVPGNSPPIAVAGPDQTVECPLQVTLDGSGSSDPDGDPLTFEWSLSGTVLGTNATLVTSLPLGTNVVTLKVTDPSGATGQANVVVRVVDTTPPTGTCPGSATASAGTDCQAAAPNLVPLVVASDGCTATQSLVITQDPAPGTPLGLGPHTIMLTVTDGSGNQAACGVQFTVSDTTPPTILKTSAPITLSAGTNCQVAVPNVLASVTAVDNCTPADQLVLAQNPAAGTLVGLGQSSIAITVSDASSNTSTATVSLNVVDTTPPTILGTPGSVTLSVGANCQATVPNVLSGVLATDNCTPAAQLTLTQNPAAGTPVGVGHSTILVSVSDASSNTATATVGLDVVDTTRPTILGTPGAVTLSADGKCQALVPNVLGNVVATDNCTSANQLVLTQNPVAGTVLGTGSYTIVVSVADASGNTSTASVPLTVVDATAPAILSVPGPITLSVNSNCQAVVPNVLADVRASDNCTPADQLVMSQTPAAGTVVGRGSYVITVTVSDAAGNTSSAGISLTVNGMTAHVTYCLTASPNVLSPPNHRLVPITVIVTPMNSCDPLPTSQIVSVTCNESTSPGEIQITGNLTLNVAATRTGYGSGRVYTITVRSTDQFGHSSTGTVTVTVPH